MSKKQLKKLDVINGRISLLFFFLILFSGLLWLVRMARYRYDLIFRPMLIWLLPTLFGVTALSFAVLLIFWIKKGRPKSEKMLDLPFYILLTIPIMAAFLFPWLTLFATGIQFYKLAVTLVFLATIGGYIGYIGYVKLGSIAILPAAGMIVNVLSLYYYYNRHLSPSSLFLNTEEYHYWPGWAVGLLMIGIVIVTHLAALLLMKKRVATLPAWAFLVPAGLTILLLAFHSVVELSLLPVRITVFSGMALIVLWYPIWCVLKKYKKI